MKAVYGEIVDIKLIRSRAMMSVTMEVPIEFHRAVVNLLNVGGPALLTPTHIEAPFGVIDSAAKHERAEPAPAEPEPAGEKVVDHPRRHSFGGLGPLCSLAVRWCKDEKFQAWLEKEFDAPIKSEQDASEFIRTYCGVSSRADLDTNPDAKATFEDVREAYSAYLARAA